MACEEKDLNDDALLDTIVEDKESFGDMYKRHRRNVVNFLVDEWFLSIMLGLITAVLSVGIDVAIEEMQQLHVHLYHHFLATSWLLSLFSWVMHVMIFTTLAAVICRVISPQAIGSGIPEVKVILHGFNMHGYLTLRTLIAKILGLTLAMGGCLPIGKEGPFVHIGAIVASLLSKATSMCQSSAFFSNEHRDLEMLSSGCAVGIACTFSAPIGAVLYAIECTSKYFAVKNYWRSFLAATCSAIVFRFANFFVTAEQSGTITAFYQTTFPADSWMVEELLVFLLLGLVNGFMAALFIFTHRKFTLFKQRSKLFGKNFLVYTLCMAFAVGMITFPLGFGRFIAGKLTFRETMADFFSNCSFFATYDNKRKCSDELLHHWMGGSAGDVHVFTSLSLYYVTYFLLTAVCISMNVPSGVFVPSIIIGAAGGRLTGEIMEYFFPEGLRAPGASHIQPGLYAVVGAASYTGAITHTVSVSIIICELTGQLTPILPVLIAMLAGNAVCKFLQPSIYESIIRIKNYPYLPDLPPSRLSVHTVKVEELMVKEVMYVTQKSKYREVKEILDNYPYLRSLPIVTDHECKILLGSVPKWYLVSLIERQMHQMEFPHNEGKRVTVEFFRRHVQGNWLSSRRHDDVEEMDTRYMKGNTLLSISPLHMPECNSHINRCMTPKIEEEVCESDDPLDAIMHLDAEAIDAAPFQLVLGSSLYKVHTLFTLLGLSHAYVTDCGRLVGVIALKELREALANIYVRGVVAPGRKHAMEAPMKTMHKIAETMSTMPLVKKKSELSLLASLRKASPAPSKAPTPTVEIVQDII